MAIYRNIVHLVGIVDRDPQKSRNDGYIDVAVQRKALRGKPANTDYLTIVVPGAKGLDQFKAGDWICCLGHIEQIEGDRDKKEPDRYDVIADVIAKPVGDPDYCNDVFLRGRLGRDPEPVQGGPTKTTLCIDRPRLSRDKDPETDFLQIVAGFEMAIAIAEFGKGQLMDVQGRLSMRETDKGVWFEITARDLGHPELPPRPDEGGRGRGGRDRDDDRGSSRNSRDRDDDRGSRNSGRDRDEDRGSRSRDSGRDAADRTRGRDRDDPPARGRDDDEHDPFADENQTPPPRAGNRQRFDPRDTDDDDHDDNT